MSRATEVDPVELLAELVAIDSANPGAGEAEIAQFVHTTATEWGMRSRIIETAQGRANVLVTIDAGGTRSLGLSGHLDTKPVGDVAGEWATPPRQLVVDGDLAYGLGTSDMKGAVAAMLVAARAWARDARRGRLELLLTADEEAGSELGAKELARRGLVDVEAVLVGEPSGITEPWEAIFVVSRGISCFEIGVQGRQGHSGLSEHLPTSATVVAAQALLAVSGVDLRYPRDPPVTAVPTVNAGVRISGGVYFGVHPGHAAVDCEIRLVPGMDRETVAADVNVALAAALPEDVTWQVRFRTDELGWLPAVAIPTDHPLVLAAADAAEHVLGRRPPLGSYPGATDASAFTRFAGVPAIASLGPGWLSVAHGPNECVGVSQVRDAVEMYRRIATNYLEDR